MSSEAILTLVPEEKEFGKEDVVTFKLRVNPGDDHSPTYEVTIPILKGTVSLRHAITFRRTIDTVFTGMGAADAGPRHDIVQRVLKDTCLSNYKLNVEERITYRLEGLQQLAREQARTDGTAAGEVGDVLAARINTAVAAVARPDINTDDVQYGINAVVDYVAPYRALNRLKRFMRRKMRKPADMKLREFYNHLLRINDEEIPNMPPNFNRDQSLQTDDLLDILLFAIPNSWVKELDRQGKDPDSMSLGDVLNTLEQIEATENGFNAPKSKDKDNKEKDSKKSSSKKNSKKKSGDSKGGFYCLYHGKNETHNTDQCKVLKAMAESAKDSKSSDGGSKNKTWKRKDGGDNKKAKKELQALVQKVAKKELQALSKKRKVSDDDSDDELNLAELNYGSEIEA